MFQGMQLNQTPQHLAPNQQALANLNALARMNAGQASQFYQPPLPMYMLGPPPLSKSNDYGEFYFFFVNN